LGQFGAPLSVYVFNTLSERIINPKPLKTMMKRFSKPFQVLFVVFLTICLVDVVNAATQSFNVDAGKETVQSIDLSAGDRLQLTFTTVGQTSSDLRFWVLFPNQTARDYGLTGQYSLGFSSEVNGACVLHFDNSNSSEPELVTLNYEIEHYIFGIPEMFLLVIAIALLLLFIVAGYIIMGKYS
jgi:hypothetical protein